VHLGGIEIALAGQRRAHKRQDVLDGRLELERTRGRLDTMRSAQEQLVAEHVTQALERVAHRGLSEAEPRADRAQLAQAHQLGEYQQQSHVEPADIDLVDV
jgi:hypothetical protein